MNIINLKVDKLIPYINNPRDNTNAIDKVASSIKEFGFKVPIVIDKNNVVVTGHTRLLASKKLGLEEVPCIVADDLTEAQIKAFRIADNKVSEYAEWDEELLKIELEQLEDLNFDLELTGFEIDELEDFIEEDFESEYNEEDDIIEVPPKVPFSKQQDIWLLGKHRLMCGSSTEKVDIERLLDGNKADMCFTDPPYLMGFKGNVHADGSKSHNAIHGEILNDKMSREDGDIFINTIFKHIKEYVKGAFYVCFYRLGLDYIYRAMDFNKIEHKALIIWNKMNHTLSNSDYMSKYEPIMYGWIKEHNFYGAKAEFDIWDIHRTKKNDLHPTMKPIPLIQRAISNSSKVGDIVLDLFGGSGSTMIASDILNRINYSMELDEKYVDVIVKRYINHKQNNGEDVYLLRDGNKIPYSEIEEEFNKEA